MSNNQNIKKKDVKYILQYRLMELDEDTRYNAYLHSPVRYAVF